ncbi:MAG: prepilin-type N-terminal cleavage/methylation domain-containing protein [Giesbergeria sp.]|nr:prepilin-type N-terminal cleavage/methylation domain-containing protein [Giesbergeria sp.]
MTSVRIQPPIGRAAGAGGFTLVEMALVLLIVGLLAAVFLPATNTMLDNSRRKETRAKLEALEQAMVRFVMVNGRLPCPADGRLRSSSAIYGLEQRTAATGVCTVINQGVVPWRSLGLSNNDAVDAWNTQITYRTRGDLPALGTSLGLTLDRALDMGECNPLGTGAASAQTLGLHARQGCAACSSSTLPSCTSPLNWLNGRGLEVRTGDGTLVLMNPAMGVGTGAAYVLISHGANRHGGYPLDTGPVGPPLVIIDEPNRGDFENNNNRNNNALQPFYINIELSEGAGNAYFDDIVVHPSVMSVVLAAGLGPRKQP